MTRSYRFPAFVFSVLFVTIARADYTINVVETSPGGGAVSTTTTYTTTSPDDDFIWTRYDDGGWVTGFKLELLDGTVVTSTAADIVLSDGGSNVISWAASLDESSASGTVTITSGDGAVDDYFLVFSGDLDQTLRVVDYQSLERMFGSVFVDSAPDNDSYTLAKRCVCKTNPEGTCTDDQCDMHFPCAAPIKCGIKWRVENAS